MRRYACFALALSLFVANEAFCATRLPDDPKLRQTPYPKSELNLKEIPFRIVYETYRKTKGRENWELYLINADGSNPVNLTRTPDVIISKSMGPDVSKLLTMHASHVGILIAKLSLI